MRAWNSSDMDNILKIEVKFFDSMHTVNDGGPRRDFLNRLLKDILKPTTGLFVDTGSGINVTHNEKLERHHYYWAGRAIAFIALAGGPSVAILAPAVYQFLVHGYDEATTLDIPPGHARNIIDKVRQCIYYTSRENRKL